MNLTISLDEPTAEWLRERASSRNQSPEEAVRELLGEASRKDAGEEAWDRANQRRVALITKDAYGGLSGDERLEMEQLQAADIARVAPLDRRMIAEAEEVLLRVKELRGGSNP